MNVRLCLQCVLVFFLLFVARTAAQKPHVHVQYEFYKVGDRVTLECKQPDGSWGPGPKCQETQKEMEFIYGTEGFQYCGWRIGDSDQMKFLTALIQREDTWMCRAAMIPQSAEKDKRHNFYIPLTIPIWGIVEKDHIHVDNHLNFVWHALHGKIIGAAAYPVRDHLQFAKQGSVITVHGPVKWFLGHSFQPFSGHQYLGNPLGAVDINTVSSFLWVILLMVVFGFSATLFYKFFLRRRLVRSLLKNKGKKAQ
eukprot:TRINITY_DN7675_c0_g1_i1.p1 TRINITY_DN7675_c0_g1~~TRINITY_DN7675_c0_g1_i1.p1  ORF type:complete len:264 (+),score=15.12 TRINITY_DN7675_c0_g1_i1:37-792(+)